MRTAFIRLPGKITNNMAQHPAIMALRKRMKNMGYTDITIMKIADAEHGLSKKYFVVATEPFSGQTVARECTVIEAGYLLQTVRR